MTTSKISKNYKKIFFDFWGLSQADIPQCWGCYQRPAVEIHHLTPKRMGGSKKNSYNVPDNLFPVCRPCHTLAHSNKRINEEFRTELKQKIDNKEFEEYGN